MKKKKVKLNRLVLIFIICVVIVFLLIIKLKYTDKQEESSRNSQVTSTIITPQPTADTTDWATYTGTSYSFKYPDTKYVVKEDNESEYGKRSSIDTRKNFVNLMNTQPPTTVLSATYVESMDASYRGHNSNGSKITATPISIWIFQNKEGLTIDQWYEKYLYYPFSYGESMKQAVHSPTSLLIDGHQAKSFLFGPPAESYFYLQQKDKMILIYISSYPVSDIGNQVLSTFKFLE